MSYNPQRGQNMNLTGTNIPSQNMNLTGTNVVNVPRAPAPNIALTTSIRQAEPAQQLNQSPVKPSGRMYNTAGYNQFVDEEVVNAIKGAQEPSDTLYSMKDVVSAIIYLVWGLVFLISKAPQDANKCPVLKNWAMYVGIYFLLLAIVKGVGLFVLRHEEAEQSKKDQVRFYMRIGRFFELFLLLCFTICLSMAASSPCDTDCGTLRTLAMIFIFISWSFLLGLIGLYLYYLNKKIHEVPEKGPFSP